MTTWVEHKNALLGGVTVGGSTKVLSHQRAFPYLVTDVSPVCRAIRATTHGQNLGSPLRPEWALTVRSFLGRADVRQPVWLAVASRRARPTSSIPVTRSMAVLTRGRCSRRPSCSTTRTYSVNQLR